MLKLVNAGTEATPPTTAAPAAAGVATTPIAATDDIATTSTSTATDEATALNAATNNRTSTAVTAAIATAEDLIAEMDDEEEAEIRSREKSDIWHEHHNVPLKKDCPAAPSIHALLRHATFAMNAVEEKNVTAVLAGKGITDTASHMFHNRAYWYQRVRMPPRKGEEASANLLAVLDFFKTSDAFREYVTPDFTKHINGWAKRCRNGRYEDLPDVDMYTHNGVDSDGLDLWISRRGSKAENFHQKMHVAVGPFGIGIETAHYLQVILAFQYMIHAGIRRCGEPDFGHTMHHLEDRIQTRIQEIWGIDLFPNRINVSNYEPLDFVSVGVGPLSLNPKYVEKGDPADCLRGDLLWMADKMGVKYPPLPPSTQREFGMIKNFCSQNPQPKQADYDRFCETFKSQSNGVDVFPKLPSMLKPAVKRWKINQQIKLLELQAGEPYKEFIQRLKGEKVSLPPPANPSKKQSASASGTQKQSSAANTDNRNLGPQKLPRPHVPPLCAPTQSRFVPVSVTNGSQNNDGKCYYWPMCMQDRRVCRGYRPELCKTFGKKGTDETPSERTLKYHIRLHSWSEYSKKSNCYWFPFCGKALVCGGRTPLECAKYGENGSHKDAVPAKGVLSAAKAKARKEERQRKRQQFKKK
jgi:hypothetical protein